MTNNTKTTPLLMKGAQSVIKLRDGGTGVLLLHGFTGTPREMAYLGDRLFDAGFSIYIPRYPGHGTTLRDITATRIRDWYVAAREAYLELSGRCSATCIAGHSLGGLFTLRIAEEFSPRGIVLISVPRGVNSRLIYLAPLIGPFKKIRWGKDRIKGVNDPEARRLHLCYDEGMPVRQTWDTFMFMKRTMRRLRRVKSPALIITSAGDETIRPDSGEYIFSHIGSASKKRISYRKSNHTIPVDYDREDLARDAIEFFLGLT